jgi:hypothetical protein
MLAAAAGALFNDRASSMSSTDHDTFERAARFLKSNGDYRVLRKLRPVTGFHAPIPGAEYRVGGRSMSKPQVSIAQPTGSSSWPFSASATIWRGAL